MGVLYVCSEGWVPPHCACYLQYGNRPAEWLGFEPNGGLIFASGDSSYGLIDTSDQSADVRVAIGFSVDDLTLWNARMQVTAQYMTEIYSLGINDCCTFAKDMCQAAGVNTPPIAPTPTTFVYSLKLANLFSCIWDPTPRPWPTSASTG